MPPRRIYLDFMGVYWSCSPDAYEAIAKQYEEQYVIKLEGRDVFELKRKPRGQIFKLERPTRRQE